MINVFELNLKNIKELDKVVKEIHKKSRVRVTIIDIDGKVLAESNKDKSTMQNHKNRAEIIGAKDKEFATAIRYSHTLNRDFMYVAKLVKVENKELFIRMAISIEKIMSDFYTLWIELTLIFAISLIVGFFIAYKIKRYISNDLEKIKTSLEMLLNKNYNSKQNGIKIAEFKSISKQIEQVSQKLQKRQKQKEKYTKKLKLLTKKQSDIISAISHEFKNPIAAIIGYSSSIEDENLDPKLKRRFVKKITNNAYKISDMIDRLSMSIKLESKNIKPKMSTFDLLKLLKEIKELLEQKYKNREILIDVKPTMIKADKTMMENLFINLIENALKYSDEEVLISMQDSIIKVIDKGIGISKNELENITKKFYTNDQLTWNNSIGVGLYIVEYILKLHDIKLKIKSKISTGSEFSFDISKLKC